MCFMVLSEDGLVMSGLLAVLDLHDLEWGLVVSWFFSGTFAHDDALIAQVHGMLCTLFAGW